jgi:hypothetical protein
MKQPQTKTDPRPSQLQRTRRRLTGPCMRSSSNGPFRGQTSRFGDDETTVALRPSYGNPNSGGIKAPFLSRFVTPCTRVDRRSGPVRFHRVPHQLNLDASLKEKLRNPHKMRASSEYRQAAEDRTVQVKSPRYKSIASNYKPRRTLRCSALFTAAEKLKRNRRKQDMVAS